MLTHRSMTALPPRDGDQMAKPCPETTQRSQPKHACPSEASKLAAGGCCFPPGVVISVSLLAPSWTKCNTEPRKHGTRSEVDALGGSCTLLLAFAQDRWLRAPDIRPQHRRQHCAHSHLQPVPEDGNKDSRTATLGCLMAARGVRLGPQQLLHFLSISFLWNGGTGTPIGGALRAAGFSPALPCRRAHTRKCKASPGRTKETQ